MKKIALFFFLATFIGYNCTNKETTKNSLLNTGKLSSQIVSIDISRDTILQTNKGAVINIPKGAFLGGGGIVRLEIKEAYSISDIIRAGLLTKSNGEPLSSGGMIYINGSGGSEIKIIKAISVAIPTSNIDKNMQLFKGKLGASGTIDWVDPTPLLPNPQTKALDAGEALFNYACASCHALGKDATGPDLAHIVKRYEQLFSKLNSDAGDTILNSYQKDHARLLLYDYTRNNMEVMSREGSIYHRCLYESYGKTAMNLFPALTDQDLDRLYAYIQNESERRNLPIPNNGIIDCIDSCTAYRQLKGRLMEVKKQLEKDSVEMAQINYRDTTAPPALATNNNIFPGSSNPVTLLDRVTPLSNSSFYYQFTIDVVGWYNIDILLKEGEGNIKSELMVRMTGQYQERFNLYLVIPSEKVFAEGGKIKDQYGFTKTGEIYMPQGVKAYIIAMGEHEDKIVFSKREFLTSIKQSLDLQLSVVNKELFEKEMEIISLPDLKIKINGSQTAGQLRKVIKELKSAEELKPKKCDCDCGILAEPAPEEASFVPVPSFPAEK
jgi:Cytochrome c